MKRYYSKWVAAIVPMFFSFIVSAQTAEKIRSSDVLSLDVGGVKIGMSFDEALAAMAKNFNVSPDLIKKSQPLSRSFNTTIIGEALPDALVYEADGTYMQVNFVARIPVDKSRPLVVWQLSYSIPWTQQNVKAMEESVRAKYGPPPDGHNFRYCKQPIQSVGMGCVSGTAEIRYDGVSVKMSDVSLSFAVTKFIDTQKSVNPKL